MKPDQPEAQTSALNPASTAAVVLEDLGGLVKSDREIGGEVPRSIFMQLGILREETLPNECAPVVDTLRNFLTTVPADQAKTRQAMEDLASQLLIRTILLPGGSYTVSERIELEHMIERRRIGTVVLEPGDVIAIVTNTSRGMSFFTDKYPAGQVIISSGKAASIKIQAQK